MRMYIKSLISHDMIDSRWKSLTFRLLGIFKGGVHPIIGKYYHTQWMDDQLAASFGLWVTMQRSLIFSPRKGPAHQVTQ